MENIPLASQKVTLPSRDSASSFQPEIFLGTRWFQALLARSWSDSDTRVFPGDVGTPVCAKPTPPSLLGGGEKASFRNPRIYAPHNIHSSFAGLEV